MRLPKYILYSLVSALFIGCTHKEEVVIHEDIVFHVQVSDVKDFSAMVTITHNATNRDFYYCFAVEGLVEDVQDEIDRFISSTPSSKLEDYKHSQRKCYFQYNRLFPEKTHTLIVFGMNDDMKLYGQPCSTSFTTTKSNLIAIENPNWHIEYKGYALYKEKDWSLITVDVLGDVEERFFLATFTQIEAETFRTTEELIGKAALNIISEIENDMDGDYWLEDSGVRTKGTNFYRWLSEGNYVFYAIGINADGTPTGHYVKTDICHVEKYPADEKYANLLDRWRISYSDGKTNHIWFEEYIVNKSLLMYGWGGVDEDAIYVSYNRANGTLSIDVQVINNDTIIRFTNGKSKEGKLILTGGYYDQESKLKSTSTITKLATVKPNESGEYVFEPAYHVSYSDGTESNDVGMLYKITDKEGSSTLFSMHMFPFTMKKE